MAQNVRLPGSIIPARLEIAIASKINNHVYPSGYAHPKKLPIGEYTARIVIYISAKRIIKKFSFRVNNFPHYVNWTSVYQSSQKKDQYI
jgi:hypothetical protein